MSKLKVENDKHNNSNKKAQRKCCDRNAMEAFLERIEKTSLLNTDWLQSLAYCQIIDLKFCKEIRRQNVDKNMSSMDIMDKAVNLWYKLPSAIKQQYRESDLTEPNTLQIKLQQCICDIYLNEKHKLLNLYTWFVAEYYTRNENNSLEDNMIAASEKFLIDIESNVKVKDNLHNTELHISVDSIYEKIHEKTSAYACFIYGPSYKNFFIGYTKLRPDLSKAEATRHSICFWTQLPKQIKARFTNETDLTASPSSFTLDDHLNWCDGGLHIGIKSVSYCPDLFLNTNTNIIDTNNKLLPTSNDHQFTFKNFFAVKRACIKWLNNYKP